MYSLLYQQHRSAYSFCIQTLTSFIQFFGFAQLVPQLIINYVRSPPSFYSIRSRQSLTVLLL